MKIIEIRPQAKILTFLPFQHLPASMSTVAKPIRASIKALKPCVSLKKPMEQKKKRDYTFKIDAMVEIF